MKLEDQVCSLELSKKLFTLGVKQKSICYWYSIKDDKCLHYNPFEDVVNPCFDDYYSAFTVAELGEMLPSILFVKNLRFEIMIDKNSKDIWRILYHDEVICFTDTNEANARAKMLIYLIENRLFTPN
jgi:hypothetical protein